MLVLGVCVFAYGSDRFVPTATGSWLESSAKKPGEGLSESTVPRPVLQEGVTADCFLGRELVAGLVA